DSMGYILCDTFPPVPNGCPPPPSLCDSAAIFYVTVTGPSIDGNPTADRDVVSTNEDTPVNINVLANDSFGINGPGTSGAITITDNANHGNAVVNNSGTPSDPTDDFIVYTPNANYNGRDTLIYQLCDMDGDCDTA